MRNSDGRTIGQQAMWRRCNLGLALAAKLKTRMRVSGAIHSQFLIKGTRILKGKFSVLVNLMSEVFKPKGLWIFVLCIWFFILLVYAFSSYLNQVDEKISSSQLRRFNKLEFLAFYFPLLCFIARAFDVINKYVKSRNESKNGDKIRLD